MVAPEGVTNGFHVTRQIATGRTAAGGLAARGESLPAFDERCIPSGGVAPRSNIPDILARRALPAGRLTRLGATPDFHHGLLARASWSAACGCRGHGTRPRPRGGATLLSIGPASRPYNRGAAVTHPRLLVSSGCGVTTKAGDTPIAPVPPKRICPACGAGSRRLSDAGRFWL